MSAARSHKRRVDQQMEHARALNASWALLKALELSPKRAAHLRMRSSYALVYQMLARKQFVLVFATLHEDGRQEIRSSFAYPWDALCRKLRAARVPLPEDKPIWRAVHEYAMDPFACPEVAHVG